MHIPDLSWVPTEGLAFRCTGCGECCRRPGWVLLTRLEADRIAERLAGEGATAETLLGELWLQEADDLFAINVGEKEPCALLDPQGRCTVHDIKPMQCATYPFWPEILGKRRAWTYEKRRCEGIEHIESERYTAADIVEICRMRATTRNVPAR
jgi:Fe-S-cluster containining protein